MFKRFTDSLKSRYMVFSLFIILTGALLLLRLFELQIIEGWQYVPKQTVVHETRRVTEIAPRGRILDRNGIPVAINSDIFTLHIVDTLDDDAGLNETLLAVTGILQKNNDSWLKDLARFLAYENGDMSFAMGDFADTENWQRNALGVDPDNIVTDPWVLFELMRGEEFYNIDAGYTNDEAYRIMSLRYMITMSRGAFETGQSVCIARDINPLSIAEIEENGHRLCGLVINVEPVREYIDAAIIAHVLGYMGAISENRYEELKSNGYTMADSVGITGVEYQNEVYLRGRDGEKRVEVTPEDGSVKQVEARNAIPGNDVILTIDLDLQKVAMESLERNINYIRNMEFNGYTDTDSKQNHGDASAGAAVAIDVYTGEVLALASYPTFDPAIFLKGPDDREAQRAISELMVDPDKSSYNRAIMGTYAPGSTFKPLTAIAALEEGIISRDSLIYDGYRVYYGSQVFRCLEGGHGWLSLKTALETSCNVFFHKIGAGNNDDHVTGDAKVTGVGITNLAKWGRAFGLGVRTGIDLPSESTGLMPTIEFKRDRLNDIWRPADTAQVSIGQLYNSFTPLQMACYMASLANGGTFYKPFVTKQVIRHDGSIVKVTEPEMRDIGVWPESINAVKEGMVASTSEFDGTAYRAFIDFPYRVAGKTGTAETGREATQDESSNSLFVCYAPADDPRIAVAVVIERGVWGSYTAPVARDILSAYFGLDERNERKDDRLQQMGAGFVQ
ncbi:MAG: penicillin-binding transpeptidase domain-containing protein [Oscillospiraceae bacterium]|nr:penicillin-binding transpeptidase domain-containing protein [Oscillospiraceae bacterium]